MPVVRHLGTCGQVVGAQAWAQSSRGGRHQLRGEQVTVAEGDGQHTWISLFHSYWENSIPWWVGTLSSAVGRVLEGKLPEPDVSGCPP